MPMSVLIAFRLQSEFGRDGLTWRSACGYINGLNRLSASVRIWTDVYKAAKIAAVKEVLIAFRLQSEFGQGGKPDNINGGRPQVLIAFRLQSEFGPRVMRPAVRPRELSWVLIAFRLQSEFGPDQEYRQDDFGLR